MYRGLFFPLFPIFPLFPTFYISLYTFAISELINSNFIEMAKKTSNNFLLPLGLLLGGLFIFKKKQTTGSGIGELNKYKIYWIALIPETGIANKSDYKTILKVNNGFTSLTLSFVRHCPTKEIAERYLSELKESNVELSKRYKAYIFSDAQMGLATKNNPDIILWSDGTGIKLTTIQKNAVIVI